MVYLRLPNTRFGFKMMLASIAAASASGFTASVLFIYFETFAPLGAKILAAAQYIYVVIFFSMLIIDLDRSPDGGSLVRVFFYSMLPPLGLQTSATLAYGDSFQIFLLLPGIPLWLVLTWVVEDKGRALFKDEAARPV